MRNLGFPMPIYLCVALIAVITVTSGLKKSPDYFTQSYISLRVYPLKYSYKYRVRMYMYVSLSN